MLHAGGGHAAVRAAHMPGAAAAAARDHHWLAQLADIVVTSVSRQHERPGSAPASVHVVSSSDIVRPGASSVPEALRLAPTLQVAFAGAPGSAVSARGLSSPRASKPPVLADGRVPGPGCRAQRASAVSCAPTLCHSDYDRLRTLVPQPGGAVFLEAWTGWQPVRGWRQFAGAVSQDIDTGAASSSLAAAARSGLATGNSRSSWRLRSSHEPGSGVRAELLPRRVARLPQPAVPDYHEPDVRLAWQARPGAEPALAGRNLLHARHPEFGEAGLRQLAEHALASATLRF